MLPRIFRLSVYVVLSLFALIVLVVLANSVDADGDLTSFLPLAIHVGTQNDDPDPTRPTPSGDGIVVDHRSVDDFDRIPDEYIQNAANLNMMFVDRSVGDNISGGLDCLSYPSDEVAPSHCKVIEHVYPHLSVDPEVISWYRDGGYDRSRWVYEPWPNGCSNWSEQLNCFLQLVAPVIDDYDVVSFQYSYLAVSERASIADQPGGFFYDNDDRYDIYDQEAFAAQHPDTVFIYWTTSLARSIGTAVSDSFNEQMRDYAVSNEKVLFDVADILSRDPDGNPCYDNRDGIPYDNGNNSENWPDDGYERDAICQHYTTEVDGGHLGAVSAGKIRVAKAFWVLMARISGWDGG